MRMILSPFAVRCVKRLKDEIIDDEKSIRDVTDRPILRAARKAGVHIFVTGDKDFLESSVAEPQIMTAAQFVNLE